VKTSRRPRVWPTPDAPCRPTIRTYREKPARRPVKKETRVPGSRDPSSYPSAFDRVTDHFMNDLPPDLRRFHFSDVDGSTIQSVGPRDILLRAGPMNAAKLARRRWGWAPPPGQDRRWTTASERGGQHGSESPAGGKEVANVSPPDGPRLPGSAGRSRDGSVRSPGCSAKTEPQSLSTSVVNFPQHNQQT